DHCLAALVRVEKTEFLFPVFIGEVVHVSAEITYTSKHSLEVQVKVIAENILTGTKKLANKAALWYVPCSLQNVDKITEVPPIKYASAEQEEEGRKRYEAQKIERLETKARVEEAMPPPSNPGTVQLSLLVHANKSGFLRSLEKSRISFEYFPGLNKYVNRRV
ncbi:Cytosolic acyl coenzyme A thioester hydrolase, partial [Characodon lateralis]|nr:Cytosolic acyl coenzyme A thioester hydrolase [Characodon lateralis]